MQISPAGYPTGLLLYQGGTPISMKQGESLWPFGHKNDSIINVGVTTDIVYLPLPHFTKKWTYDRSPVTIKATKPNRKEDVLCLILIRSKRCSL